MRGEAHTIFRQLDPLFRLSGGQLVPLAAGTASAVELRDAEMVAGGPPVLQNAGSPDNAWAPNFRNGNVFDNFKTSVAYVRGVRVGSCHCV